VNPIAAFILLGILLAVLFAPARWALLAIMAGVLYLTQGQQIQAFGVNLFAIRFIEVAGFIRVIVRRELWISRMGRIHQTLLLLYTYATIVFLVRSNEGQAYQIGLAVDALLCYYTFRGLVTSPEDLRWFLKAFVFLLVPYVGLILLESLASQNAFSSFGIVSYFYREGRIRCQGSFRHPSLLGSFGASFLPLYIGLWFSKDAPKLALLAIGLCLTIVWASNSGGPISCVTVALIGWMLWLLRRRMHVVRRALSATIVLTALFMKAPVWYLPAKFSLLSGGDGWHRSYLIDQAFSNLSKWWLAGIPIKDTSPWFPYSLQVTGGADLTNAYLAFGVAAGLPALVLFVVLLKRSFSNLGKALAIVRNDRKRSDEILYWSLSVVLAVHTVNWLGVTYFDQMYVVWFFHIAVISTLTERVIRSGQYESTKKSTVSPFIRPPAPIAASVQ
jgi:hypothetical protein